MNRLWAMMRMLIWPKIDRKPQPCKDRYVWKFLDANIWNNFHEIWATADNVWNMSDCRTARGWRKKHKLFWFFHLKIKYSVTINLDCCFDNKNKSEYSFFINKKETKNKGNQLKIWELNSISKTFPPKWNDKICDQQTLFVSPSLMNKKMEFQTEQVWRSWQCHKPKSFAGF